MNERRAARLRAAVLGGGVAALAVCALAALDAMARGRMVVALFFTAPWLLLVVFATVRPPGRRR